MVLPDNATFQEWVSSLNVDFPNGFIPILVDEDNWQQYAVLVNRIPEIVVNGPPDPYSYNNWRDWASRLIEVNF